MVRRRRKSNRKTRKLKGGGIQISYPSFVVNNSETTINNTRNTPTLRLLALKLSTFVMYDPDASIPQWLHYLVINIPNGDITKGETIVHYSGPSPPPGTGVHRYIFEQLEQQNKYSINSIKPSGFNITTFSNIYSLISKAKKMFRVVS